MSCTQSINVGVDYGKTFAETRSVSERFTADVGLTIKKIFSVNLGYSRTSGHDWTTTSSESYRRTTSVSASCTAAPGTSVELHQLIGYCSEIQIQTPTYKCVVSDTNETRPVEPRVSEIRSDSSKHHIHCTVLYALLTFSILLGFD